MEKKSKTMRHRCHWVTRDPEYIRYHDTEWGVPVHDDKRLLEFLILESAQAGLSWITILKRRQGYERAFAGFDPEKVAAFTPETVDALVQDRGIIRNRSKITAAVTNARAFLTIREKFGSFDAYAWDFVEGRQKINCFERGDQVPSSTVESERFSKDLKQRGFSFVGPTIIYAYMQAVGMVNDHLTSCFRYHEVMEG